MAKINNIDELLSKRVCAKDISKYAESIGYDVKKHKGKIGDAYDCIFLDCEGANFSIKVGDFVGPRAGSHAVYKAIKVAEEYTIEQKINGAGKALIDNEKECSLLSSPKNDIPTTELNPSETEELGHSKVAQFEARFGATRA